MEHIDIIIQKSTEDKLNRLAYQAVDDPKGFKKVMMLTVYDDLIQWADSLDDLVAVKFLKSKVEKLLSKYPECFSIPTNIRYNNRIYTNVNIPQFKYTWNNEYLSSDESPIYEIDTIITIEPKV